MSIHSGHGYSGSNYDRVVERSDTSTLHKFKETFWTTKQAVIQKLGKKEDEHVVASDAELDSKLEVFKAIQKSCMELLRVIEKYQDRLCTLSMEENATGRFLKSNSGQDKTRAGKMMAAVGKSQSFSAQQRLALRVPLVRLYQEVETFRYRAISDTLMTINRMEGARTEYRGALLWMKDVSEQLDPDTFKQLEKFRKVQAQVKKTKARFDKLKLDVMQKVDLLAASRCNMFSHVLANYQSSLLHFWEKTSRTMTAVAESFKGYQYYEFNVIKELQEPAQQLAETTKQSTGIELGEDFDPEKLISLDESKSEDVTPTAENTSLQNFFSDPTDTQSRLGQGPEYGKVANGRVADQKTDEDPNSDLFLDFGEEAKELSQDFDFNATKHPIPKKPIPKNVPKDLLSEELEPDDTDKDDMTILNEILNAPSAAGEDDFSREWQAVFGHTPLGMSLSSGEIDQSQDVSGFMPSSLLDMNQQMGNLNMNATGGVPGSVASQSDAGQAKQLGAKPKQTKKGQKDMSAWFSLFADLDPLADPDSVGKKSDSEADPCMG